MGDSIMINSRIESKNILNPDIANVKRVKETFDKYVLLIHIPSFCIFNLSLKIYDNVNHHKY